MSTKWPVTPIKELCEDVNVGFVGPSTKFRDDEGIPFLMGKNVGSGFLKLKNLDRVSTQFHIANKKSQLRGGDVVVVRIGNSGQACTIPEDFGEANCAGLVIIKQPRRVLAEYLTYYLNSPIGRSYSMSQAIGSTRSTLNTSTVANTLVPLPPLDEQKRIVGKLDEALGDLDKATEDSKIALNQIDALWTSSLVHELNPESENPKKYGVGNRNTVSLSDVADFVMGQAPPGSASNFDGNGTVFVKVGEFGSLYPIVREWTTQPLKFAKSGDVLICVVGATVGKLNLAIDCAIGRSVAAIRPKSNLLDQKFLYLYLKTIVTSVRNDSSGTAQGVISQKYLQSIDIPLPTLEEQIQIVAKLDGLMEQIEASRTTKLRAIDEANSLRSSILSAAFAGDF